MPEVTVPICETHGKQGWHGLLATHCEGCATMVAGCLLISATAISSAARFMPSAQPSVGMDHVIQHLNFLFNTTIKVSQREAFLRTVRAWLANHAEFMEGVIMPQTVEGKTQPEIIFCPEGHVMQQGNRGSVNATAMCITRGCAHFGIAYDVQLPAVLLKRRASEDSAPAGVPGAE